MEKSTHIHLRISPEEKSRLKEAADQAQLSISAYLRNLIPKKVEAN